MRLRPSAYADGARSILLLLILLAFAFRLYQLDYQSLWRDEVDAILFARRDLAGLVDLFVTPGHNGPLYYLMLHFWIGLVGDSEFGARFFSLICGVVAVPLIFKMARYWVGRSGSLLAALLCATSPYAIWYSQEAKMYALLFLLSMLSTHIYLLALERNRIWLWLSYLVALVASMYVHLLAVLIVPFHALLFLVTWPRYRRALRAWIATFALLILPYLPLARWEIPLLTSSVSSGYEFYRLHEMLTVLLFAFSVNAPPRRGELAIAVFIFLLLAGIFLYRRTAGSSGSASLRALLARRQESISLSLYLFVPVLCLFLISLARPLFTDRYLITVLPAYLLLLACGVIVIRRRSRLQSVICLALVLVSSLYTVWWQAHTMIKSDFRAAAKYVKEDGRGDLMMFLVPHGRLVFDYYYQDQYSWVDAPFTNRDVEAEEVAQEMEQGTAGHEEVWFIVSEEELWDSRRLVRGWFDEHAALLGHGRFTRVEAYLYALES